jgi:hypothetical protein
LEGEIGDQDSHERTRRLAPTQEQRDDALGERERLEQHVHVGTL